MAVRQEEIAPLETGAHRNAWAGPRPELTTREAQVLELLAAGLSTGEVARHLYVSPQAVTYHVGNMLAKLGCPNRTALVARAFVLGLLEAGTWPPVLSTRARVDA